jgi:hypothetical protein
MATTQQITATPRNSSGTAITGKTLVWTSDNTGVATVSSTGLVSAIAPGQAGVSASVDGVVATSTVNVTAPAAQFIRLDVNTAPVVATSQSTSVAGNVNRFGGYSGTVTITAPTNIPNVTVTVGPSTETQAATLVIPNGQPTQFFMTVTAAANATPGVHLLNLTATGPGSPPSNFVAQLTISATATPSITGTVSTQSITITRGTPVNVTVNIVRNGGYTGPVTPSIDSSTLGGNFVVNNGNNTLGTVTFTPPVIGSGQTQCVATVSLPTGWTAGTADPNFLILRLTGDGVASTSLPPIIFTPA